MANDIEKAFGLPNTVTGFTDGVDRIFYPFKMCEIKKFFEIFQRIPDIKKLMINYLIEGGEEALKDFFAMCFQDNPFEDLETAIDIDNYSSIMKQCFEICGLTYPTDDEDIGENPQTEV